MCRPMHTSNARARNSALCRHTNQFHIFFSRRKSRNSSVPGFTWPPPATVSVAMAPNAEAGARERHQRIQALGCNLVLHAYLWPNQVDGIHRRGSLPSLSHRAQTTQPTPHCQRSGMECCHRRSHNSNSHLASVATETSMHQHRTPHCHRSHSCRRPPQSTIASSHRRALLLVRPEATLSCLLGCVARFPHRAPAGVSSCRHARREPPRDRHSCPRCRPDSRRRRHRSDVATHH
jgi:hypothetical protein